MRHELAMRRRACGEIRADVRRDSETTLPSLSRLRRDSGRRGVPGTSGSGMAGSCRSNHPPSTPAPPVCIPERVRDAGSCRSSHPAVCWRGGCRARLVHLDGISSVLCVLRASRETLGHGGHVGTAPLNRRVPSSDTGRNAAKAPVLKVGFDVCGSDWATFLGSPILRAGPAPACVLPGPSPPALRIAVSAPSTRSGARRRPDVGT